MAQVNFYSLQNEDLESRLLFACRLTEKARSLGHQVFIQTESEQQSQAMSKLLWEYRPGAFIPHTTNATGSDANLEPVAIGQESHAAQHHDVLINLDKTACAAPEKFSRINEIICADPAVLALGRERYRHYAKGGHALETFKI